MKQWWTAVVCGCLVGVCLAQGTEKFDVVKVSDLAGNVSYQVATADKLKALRTEIALETKLLPKAMALAEKEWKSAEETARKPYPKTAISGRKAVVLATLTDQALADARVEALQKKDQEKEESDKARLEKQSKAITGKAKEMAEKDAEKNQEKEKLLEMARTIFTAKLTELKSAEEAKASESAAKPAEEKKATGETAEETSTTEE